MRNVVAAKLEAVSRHHVTSVKLRWLAALDIALTLTPRTLDCREHAHDAGEMRRGGAQTRTLARLSEGQR
ncbi:hypothetical protein FR943_17775 [Mycobacterium sp. TNTM28]|uniref:Uncharacterized protein n=1 Tax=[Mycobacterium] fortunisiensis TaxID=2600579 RepID=A0ABS6KPY5_9MYCO|nr:hypothetical protein [[Mycobacterium] fortunisiensis]MBU9765686.1 hypothetical protein [[Mycobacterium] fortunisiensis]